MSDRRMVKALKANGCTSTKGGMPAEGVAAVKYTVTAKRWRKGWELHIDGVGVTQVRVLGDAAQQAADYIETLKDTVVAPEDIEITPQLEDAELLEDAAAARAEVRAAEAAQREAARHQREVARRLRDVERLSVSDTATVMKVTRGRVSQLTKI